MSIRTLGEASPPGPLPPRRGADHPGQEPGRKDASALPAVDVRDLERAIGAVNQMLDPLARGLQFSLDESTGTTVVKLVDKETNQVLRQIPSKEMLSIARALDRVQGLLVNAKA
jgi:flagellar protein FlaG